MRTSYLAASPERAGPSLPSSTQVAGDDGRFTLRGLPRDNVHRGGDGEWVDLGVGALRPVLRHRL